MYFFQYFSQLIVLFNVLVIRHALSNESKNGQEFSNLLKNITLANKILQDLLDNYDRLEKIYPSEEIVQGSSSQEIKTFKSFTSRKQNYDQRERSHSKYTSRPYLGTVMVYASESVENESDDSTKEEIKEVKTNRKPTKSYSHYVNDYEVDHKQVVNKKNENKKVLHNKFQKERILTKISSSKNKAKINDKSSGDTQSYEVEQIFIDIPQDISDTDKNIKDISDTDKNIKDISDTDKNIKDISDVSVATNALNKTIAKNGLNKPIKNMMGEKTRFSIQHAPKIMDRNDISQRYNKFKNNGRTINKIVHSDSFSPGKIWEEDINKPVKLKNAREQNFRKRNEAESKNEQKMAILILTNYDKGHEILNEGSIRTRHKTKELSQINLLKQKLRSEYGDTCLQMPIKKCKKALKIVNKNICKRRFKCKSDFKSDFIQNSEDGCNREFSYIEETDNKTNTTKENIEKFNPPEFRELKMKTLKNKRKRQNIKSILENKLQDFRSLRNETPQEDFLRKRKLRDKYEKKCQKESMRKCNNSCDFAIKETCSVHTCEKRIKKAIKRECKNQCKKVYNNDRKSIRSSSNSESDSDSESESGSD